MLNIYTNLIIVSSNLMQILDHNSSTNRTRLIFLIKYFEMFYWVVLKLAAVRMSINFIRNLCWMYVSPVVYRSLSPFDEEILKLKQETKQTT